MAMAESSPGEKSCEGVPALDRPAEHFETLLGKAILLKEFAIKNNYEVDPKILKETNDLIHKVTTGYSKAVPPAANPSELVPTADDLLKLDRILANLTSTTFPTTIDSLSRAAESRAYLRFKRRLIYVAVIALLGAIIGFVFSVISPRAQLLSNSILALFLGLLGALVYSFFGVLRVIPAQAFNPEDEYANYARLLLGLLLGWVFYFAFTREAFERLAAHTTAKPTGRADVLLLLLPFVAGYSTKFVIGVLERTMVALETALAISDGRNNINRLTRRNRP
jgi:hypothetical protein